MEREVVELEPIFIRRGGQLVRVDGYPLHLDRFERAGIDVARAFGPSMAAEQEGAA